jgi:hypothetical protein
MDEMPHGNGEAHYLNVDDELVIRTRDDPACNQSSELLHALDAEDGMTVPPQPASHPLDPLALGLDQGSEGSEPLAVPPPPISAEQLLERERRKRRREAWEREQVHRRRWELQQKLIDISTEMEVLSREVRTPMMCHALRRTRSPVLISNCTYAVPGSKGAGASPRGPP